MVHLIGIDQAFLHLWLSVYRIKEDELHLRRGDHRSGKAQFINDPSLVRRIKSDHNDFKSRKSNLQTYFDRSIIEFKRSNAGKPFFTSIQSISQQPVIVCKTRGKYCLTQPSDQLKAKKPIRMSLKHIFSIYDIHHDFVDSSIGECVELENSHNVECRFYHLDGNKAYWTSELPGFRKSVDRQIINIAVDNGNYYWLASSNLIEERHYCTKNTSKCKFYANDSTHRKIHEANCSTESIIRSKQVLYLMFTYAMVTYDMFMPRMICSYMIYFSRDLVYRTVLSTRSLEKDCFLSPSDLIFKISRQPGILKL